MKTTVKRPERQPGTSLANEVRLVHHRGLKLGRVYLLVRPDVGLSERHARGLALHAGLRRYGMLLYGARANRHSD